jgi:hypothetical protein
VGLVGGPEVPDHRGCIGPIAAIGFILLWSALPPTAIGRSASSRQSPRKHEATVAKNVATQPRRNHYATTRQSRPLRCACKMQGLCNLSATRVNTLTDYGTEGYRFEPCEVRLT